MWCRFHGMDAHPNCDTAGCRAEEVRLSLIHTYGSAAWWQTIQPVYGAPMPAARTAPCRRPFTRPRAHPLAADRVPAHARRVRRRYKRAACTADNCDALEAIALDRPRGAGRARVPAGEKRSRLMKMCAETECARSETGLRRLHPRPLLPRAPARGRALPARAVLAPRRRGGARRQRREEVRERRRLKIQS